jgi:hypothetical protein
MTEFVTTLNRIREYLPCVNGWKRLLESLGKTTADDEPVPFRVILESNGLDDALWCCRTAPEYDKEWRLYAVWCARRVQHLMTDERSLNALDVAEKSANGRKSAEELATACEAAWTAVRATPYDAAGVVQRNAAWAAAWAASHVASQAALRTAAHAAAGVVEGAAARAAQRGEFLRIVSGKG